MVAVANARNAAQNSMSAAWAVLFLLATFSVFVWLLWAYPLIAVIWFLAGCLVLLLFFGAVDIVEEGERE